MTGRSGLATPIGSIYAASAPQFLNAALANTCTCLARPVAGSGGTAAQNGNQTSAASGGAGGGGLSGGGLPNGEGPPGGGGDGSRGQGTGGGRRRMPTQTPERKATRGFPGGDGDGGGGDNPDGDGDGSEHSEDSAASATRSKKKPTKIDPFTILKFPEIGDFKR